MTVLSMIRPTHSMAEAREDVGTVVAFTTTSPTVTLLPPETPYISANPTVTCTSLNSGVYRIDLYTSNAAIDAGNTVPMLISEGGQSLVLNPTIFARGWSDLWPSGLIDTGTLPWDDAQEIVDSTGTPVDQQLSRPGFYQQKGTNTFYYVPPRFPLAITIAVGEVENAPLFRFALDGDRKNSVPPLVGQSWFHLDSSGCAYFGATVVVAPGAGGYWELTGDSDFTDVKHPAYELHGFKASTPPHGIWESNVASDFLTSPHKIRAEGDGVLQVVSGDYPGRYSLCGSFAGVAVYDREPYFNRHYSGYTYTSPEEYVNTEPQLLLSAPPRWSSGASVISGVPKAGGWLTIPPYTEYPTATEVPEDGILHASHLSFPLIPTIENDAVFWKDDAALLLRPTTLTAQYQKITGLAVTVSQCDVTSTNYSWVAGCIQEAYDALGDVYSDDRNLLYRMLYYRALDPVHTLELIQSFDLCSSYVSERCVRLVSNFTHSGYYFYAYSSGESRSSETILNYTTSTCGGSVYTERSQTLLSGAITWTRTGKFCPYYTHQAAAAAVPPGGVVSGGFIFTWDTYQDYSTRDNYSHDSSNYSSHNYHGYASYGSELVISRIKVSSAGDGGFAQFHLPESAMVASWEPPSIPYYRTISGGSSDGVSIGVLLQTPIVDASTRLGTILDYADGWTCMAAYTITNTGTDDRTMSATVSQSELESPRLLLGTSFSANYSSIYRSSGGQPAYHDDSGSLVPTVSENYGHLSCHSRYVDLAQYQVFTRCEVNSAVTDVDGWYWFGPTLLGTIPEYNSRYLCIPGVGIEADVWDRNYNLDLVTTTGSTTMGISSGLSVTSATEQYTSLHVTFSMTPHCLNNTQAADGYSSAIGWFGSGGTVSGASVASAASVFYCTRDPAVLSGALVVTSAVLPPSSYDYAVYLHPTYASAYISELYANTTASLETLWQAVTAAVSGGEVKTLKVDGSLNASDSEFVASSSYTHSGAVFGAGAGREFAFTSMTFPVECVISHS